MKPRLVSSTPKFGAPWIDRTFRLQSDTMSIVIVAATRCPDDVLEHQLATTVRHVVALGAIAARVVLKARAGDAEAQRVVRKAWRRVGEPVDVWSYTAPPPAPTAAP